MANNQKIWNIIFISFLISLILIFAVYWQYHKRKKTRRISPTKENKKRMQEEQYNQSLACIEENRRQIKKLEQSLQSAESIKVH